MLWFHSLLLFVAVVLTIYYYITRTFNYWKIRCVITAKPVPLFGNLLESTLRRQFIGSDFKKLYEQFPNEKVVGVYTMTTPCLLIRDLDIIKHIMIKDFNYFIDRRLQLSNESLGANLFHADGDTWQILRNRFTPLFTCGKLKNMTYLMTERADKFVSYINSLVHKNPEQEVLKLVQTFTIMTISACAFGLDMDVDDDHVKLLKSFADSIFRTSYIIDFDVMYPGILKKLNLSLFGSTVTNYFHDIVKTAINKRNGMPSGRKDLMDLILELRQQHEVIGTKKYGQGEQQLLQISEDVIAAQAFVFYVAGYETSATTMSFMLYHLAKNQHIQDKLLAEIDGVLQKYDEKITYDSLNEMSYMDNVFAETLRLHPIVDPLKRNARSDYKVPGTNIVVKKGQTVLVTPSGIHYDPKYYSNPEKFDPDRFRTENIRNVHPCAYIPFGIGPRNCIGMRFAKLQSRVCMSKLLSNFRVEPSKDTPTELKYDPLRVIMSPRGGIPLNFVPRKQCS